MATRVKQKAAARKANADKRPRAVAKYVRVSPRKVQIVIDLIRGKQVDDALAILMYTPKSAAPVVEKLLNSAIANAENNLEMSRENLYVAEVYANQGPTLKRYWARSHGRADLIKKHTSHITIVLDQKNEREDRKWVRKSIPTALASVSFWTGAPSGTLEKRIFPITSSRITSSGRCSRRSSIRPASPTSTSPAPTPACM